MCKQKSSAKDKMTEGRNQEGRFLSSFGHGTLSAHLVSWFFAVFAFWFLSPLFVEACHKVFFKNQDDFSPEAINSSVQTLFTGMGFAAAAVALWYQSQTTKSAQAQREYDAFVTELPVIQLRFRPVSPGDQYLVDIRVFGRPVESFQIFSDRPYEIQGKEVLGWFSSPFLRPDPHETWHECPNFGAIKFPATFRYQFHLPSSGVQTGVVTFRFDGIHLLISSEDATKLRREELNKKYGTNI